MPDTTPIELANQLRNQVAGNPRLLFLVSQVLVELDACRHGPDFANVIWRGMPYTFTSGQAAVVRILWDAWENGTPEVRQETLLDGMETRRIQHLFRDNPAFGTMIVPGERVRGTFRLI